MKKETNLSTLRKGKNLSQSQLSKEADVSCPMIQKYEQGVKDINKASALTLYKISRVLDCTIEDLLELNK